MKRFGNDRHAGFALSGAGTLRAAILACGFGSLAAFAQAPEGSVDRADGGLAVSLGVEGYPYPGFGPPLAAGQRVTLVAATTGGTGTVRYDWDFDDDGVVDRSGTQSQVEAVYSSEFVRDDDEYYDDFYGIYYDGEVTVRATDGVGNQATASVLLHMDVAQVGAVSTGPFNEVCGDGDALKEPGERWRVTMAPFNGGLVGASAGYALLTPGDRWLAAAVGEPVVGAFTIRSPGYRGRRSGRRTAFGGSSPRGHDPSWTIQIARTAPCGSRIEIRNDTASIP